MNQLLANDDFPTGPGLGKEDHSCCPDSWPNCPLGKEPAAGQRGGAQRSRRQPHVIDRLWQRGPSLPALVLTPSQFCFHNDYRFLPTPRWLSESPDAGKCMSNWLMDLNSGGKRQTKMAWCYYRLTATFGHVICAIF